MGHSRTHLRATGDLKASQDFRSLYAELLTSVLGADPAPVIGTDVAASHILV
jgi:hypothetical protein